jgi:hypothetical protein
MLRAHVVAEESQWLEVMVPFTAATALSRAAQAAPLSGNDLITAEVACMKNFDNLCTGTNVSNASHARPTNITCKSPIIQP